MSRRARGAEPGAKPPVSASHSSLPRSLPEAARWWSGAGALAVCLPSSLGLGRQTLRATRGGGHARPGPGVPVTASLFVAEMDVKASLHFAAPAPTYQTFFAPLMRWLQLRLDFDSTAVRVRLFIKGH